MNNYLIKEPYNQHWIVFTDGQHALKGLLKEGFSHCYIITKDAFNWIEINPCQGQLLVTILPYSIDVDVPRALSKTNSVIKVTSYYRQQTRVHKLFGLYNCVSHVRYILGMSLPLFTPYQMYKYLLRLTEQQKSKFGIVKAQLL